MAAKTDIYRITRFISATKQVTDGPEVRVPRKRHSGWRPSSLVSWLGGADECIALELLESFKQRLGSFIVLGLPLNCAMVLLSCLVGLTGKYPFSRWPDATMSSGLYCVCLCVCLYVYREDRPSTRQRRQLLEIIESKARM